MHILGNLGEMHGIAWSTVNGINPKVLNHLDLPFCITNTSWNNRTTDLFCTIMESKTTSKQRVVGSILEHVAFAESDHRQIAGNQFRPTVQIIFGICNNRRFTGSTGRCVNPIDAVHRNRKEPKRISATEIGFLGKRDL